MDHKSGVALGCKAASSHIEKLALIDVDIASANNFARGHEAEADLLAAAQAVV